VLLEPFEDEAERDDVLVTGDLLGEGLLGVHPVARADSVGAEDVGPGRQELLDVAIGELLQELECVHVVFS
jgi:hypothetical protein